MITSISHIFPIVDFVGVSSIVMYEIIINTFVIIKYAHIYSSC